MDVGSHPNNVGRMFNPMDTKSSEVAGIGGNLLWDDARMLFSLRFVLMGDVPLQKLVSLGRQRHREGLTWARHRGYRRWEVGSIVRKRSG